MCGFLATRQWSVSSPGNEVKSLNTDLSLSVGVDVCVCVCVCLLSPITAAGEAARSITQQR